MLKTVGLKLQYFSRKLYQLNIIELNFVDRVDYDIKKKLIFNMRRIFVQCFWGENVFH